jgi:hypothetical protein
MAFALFPLQRNCWKWCPNEEWTVGSDGVENKLMSMLTQCEKARRRGGLCPFLVTFPKETLGRSVGCQARVGGSAKVKENREEQELRSSSLPQD